MIPPMHDSQTIEQSSDLTLFKLLEVEADLAAQAAALTAQLKDVQEKHHSLQIVIGMFTPTSGSTSAVQLKTATAEINGQLEPTAKLSLEPLSATSTAESTSEVTLDNQPEVSEKPRVRSRRQPARVNKAHKTTGSSRGWQGYVRQEFAKLSLPEAVASVLQRHSDEVLGVPVIVNFLFVDEIPQAVRSEARNRVSNVLSIGLKNNKWYRGKKGQYSSSREAAKANLTS